MPSPVDGSCQINGDPASRADLSRAGFVCDDALSSSETSCGGNVTPPCAEACEAVFVCSDESTQSDFEACLSRCTCEQEQQPGVACTEALATAQLCIASLSCAEIARLEQPDSVACQQELSAQILACSTD